MAISFWTCALLLAHAVRCHLTNQTYRCKPLPRDAHWPTQIQWQALNKTVSGRLSAPLALGSICHPKNADYSNASCTALNNDWTSSLWQEHNPWTSMYNDDTCLPSANTPCSTAGYPAYVISAKTAADVQASVRFAAETGVRLIVKGTGHDVPGRSSGADSLSIWTHHLQGLQINMHDPVAVANGGVASVKLGAGMVWGDIYEQVGNANLTVIGGADPHVGMGGWTQGGGHGPLTALFGLGADQVLKMEVVTADGTYRVINATSDSDLFWAMRGGGPSSFAIMLSMTVKAYSKVDGYEYSFSYNTTASSDTFWDLVTHFSSWLPGLSDKGVMGYYYPIPDGGLANHSTNGAIAGSLLFPSKTKSEVDAIIKPLESSLSSPSWAKDPIYVSSKATGFDNFLKFWHANNPAEAVGDDRRYCSWLLDRLALSSADLGKSLREVTPLPWTWIGHFVAGPGVANAKPAGDSNAVLPAWRKALVHLLQPRLWTPLNTTEQHRETTAIRDEVQPALRALAPDSGAYMNEADPSNPHWKEDYFGENYDKLLDIKYKWDPKGVFWCKPCVGFDEWDIVALNEQNVDVHDRGIGQDQVRLCRKHIQ